jgi:hypothetical protein
MNYAADRPYLGPEKYSYVPDGLVSHVAPTPGQLCIRCSTLDIPGYFIDSPADDLIYDSEHMLGSLDEIINKPDCSFCELVVAALKARLPEVVAGRFPLATLDNSPVRVYLGGSLAGSFYLASQFWGTPFLGNKDKQSVYCITVYTNVIFPPAIRTANRDRAFIRLLASDAHLLGQHPMYHGRLTGNHASPSLLYVHSTRSHCLVHVLQDMRLLLLSNAIAPGRLLSSGCSLLAQT